MVDKLASMPLVEWTGLASCSRKFKAAVSIKTGNKVGLHVPCGLFLLHNSDPKLFSGAAEATFKWVRDLGAIEPRIFNAQPSQVLYPNLEVFNPTSGDDSLVYAVGRKSGWQNTQFVAFTTVILLLVYIQYTMDYPSRVCNRSTDPLNSYLLYFTQSPNLARSLYPYMRSHEISDKNGEDPVSDILFLIAYYHIRSNTSHLKRLIDPLLCDADNTFSSCVLLSNLFLIK